MIASLKHSENTGAFTLALHFLGDSACHFQIGHRQYLHGSIAAHPFVELVYGIGNILRGCLTHCYHNNFHVTKII